MPNFAYISARNLSWLGDTLTVNFMPSTYAPNRFDTTLTATALFTADLVTKSVTSEAFTVTRPVITLGVPVTFEGDPVTFEGEPLLFGFTPKTITSESAQVVQSSLFGQIGALKSEAGTIGSVVISRGTTPILYCDIDPNFVANGAFVLTDWALNLIGVQGQVAQADLWAFYTFLYEQVLIDLYETDSASTYTTYLDPEGIPAEVYAPCSIVTTSSVAGFASPIAVYTRPEAVSAELYSPCSIVETGSLYGFGFPTVHPVYAPTIAFDIRPSSIGRPEIVITADAGSSITVDLLRPIPEGYTVDLYRAVDFARGRFELLQASATFPYTDATVTAQLSYKYEAVYRVSTLKGANSPIVYRTINPL
jgi:hypothetical protein